MSSKSRQGSSKVAGRKSRPATLLIPKNIKIIIVPEPPIAQFSETLCEGSQHFTVSTLGMCLHNRAEIMLRGVPSFFLEDSTYRLRDLVQISMLKPIEAGFSFAPPSPVATVTLVADEVVVDTLFKQGVRVVEITVSQVFVPGLFTEEVLEVEG